MTAKRPTWSKLQFEGAWSRTRACSARYRGWYLQVSEFHTKPMDSNSPVRWMFLAHHKKTDRRANSLWTQDSWNNLETAQQAAVLYAEQN